MTAFLPEHEFLSTIVTSFQTHRNTTGKFLTARYCGLRLPKCDAFWSNPKVGLSSVKTLLNLTTSSGGEGAGILCQCAYLK